MKHVKLFEGYKSNWEDEENFDHGEMDDEEMKAHQEEWLERYGDRRVNSIELSNLLEFLNLISDYKVELYEVIEIIEKILSSTNKEIIEQKEHLETNATKSEIDELTLHLIDILIEYDDMEINF